MIITVDNVGKAGLVRDLQPHQLPPQAWTKAENIRFRNGNAEKIKGHQEVFAGATIDPYWLLPWPGALEHRWIYAGQDYVYYVSGSSHTDITRASGVYTGTVNNLWNGVLFGGVPVLNNGIDKPQSWDSGTSKLVDMPNFPATVKPKIIRGFKQFLIGMNTVESGTNYYPYKVMWSDVADPGTIPTTWDATDATSLAGDNTLSETGGEIIDGESLGNIFYIYKADSVWAMEFIGGTFVFGFRMVFKDFGILAQRCAKAFSGGHFVVTQGDVKVHNGQSHQSVIDPLMRKELFSSIDSEHRDKVFVTPNYAYNEMWICYPTIDATAGMANRALIWNWRDGTWSYRDLPGLSHIGFGLIDEGGASPIINSVTTVIDNDSSIINGVRYSATELKMLAASRAAQKFYHMDLSNLFDGAPFTATLERQGLSIMKQSSDGARRVDPTATKFVRSIYPEVELNQSAAVNVYVGAQTRVEGPVTWYGPFAFLPDTGQIKIDCRVSGKLVGVRFTSTGDVAFELSGYHVDFDWIGMPWPA